MTTDLRLALPAAAAWIVLGVLLAVPSMLGSIAVLLWGAAVVVGTVALLLLRRSRVTRTLTGTILVAIVLTALLLSCAAAAQPGRRPAAVAQAAQTARYVTVTAVAEQVPRAGGAPIGVMLSEVKIGAERYRVHVPALLFGELDKVSGAGIGSVLTLSGTLAAAAPEDDVAFLLFARGTPVVVAEAPWFLSWANVLRKGFLSSSRSLPGDGGGLLAGLAIGDTSAVSAGLDGAMKATSLSHLTAVSGANCAVVIALIMFAGGALRMPRGWRIAACLIVLAAFVVLVTPEASVLRSAAMATLVLIALGSGRPVRGLPILALAAVILLAQDPWLARSYGFILSVLATGGLLVLARPLTRILARWLPAALAATIAIPLAAQLACQPVLILLSPMIPTYGVVANLLSEPAAPAATVLGLIACVLLPVAAPLGQLLLLLAWLPASWIAAVARFFSAAPGSQLPWLPGLPGVALLSVFVAGVIAVILWPGRGGARSVLAAVLVVCVVGYLGTLSGGQLRRQLTMPQHWQIAACDIGQGDAVLVRSNGAVALIDTGPDPALLSACLRELSITRIQLLVLTHYDLDHVGGTAAVLGMVDRALVGPVSDTHDERLRESLTRSGAHLEQASQGLNGELGDLAWKVLWPPRRVGIVEPGNDASVTVRFDPTGACQDGCLSSLFLGDLGDEPQARLMAANRIPPVQVVKVAHHGSADQNPRMYELLHATVGVISVGADNDYGHPTATALGLLAAAGTTPERTDQQGLILLSAGREGVEVWSERGPPRR